MSVRFVASFGSSRLDVAADWIRGHGHSILVVAPAIGAAHDLVREAAATTGGLLDVHRASWRSLISELARPVLAARQQSPLSRLGTEALVTRAISAATPAAAAGYFAPVSHLPGFPRALTRTLSRLIENAVAGRDLVAGPAGCSDLAGLLGTLRLLETELGLAIPSSVLETAVSVLDSGDCLLPASRLLLIDPVVESVLEERLVGGLIAAGREAMLTAPAVDGELIRRLSDRLRVTPELLDSDRPPTCRLERLRMGLFAPAIAAEMPPDPSFEFFSAPSEGRECVELARRIHRMAGAGTPFDRMAIWLRDPDLYLPHLQDALHRAEIPAWFTSGTIRPNPAGRAFLSLLDCAADGLSAARFAEYLSLAQSPVPKSEPAGAVEVPWVPTTGDGQLTFISPLELAPADTANGATADGEEGETAASHPYRWEELLVEASVVGGVDRWERRLKGLEAEFRLQLEASPEDEGVRSGLRARLEGLRHLESFALPLVRQLADLPTQCRWGRWLEALRRLAVCSLRNPEPVLQLLGQLDPMAGVGPVELPEVRSVLADHLLFLRVEPEGDRYGRVLVGTLDEASGRRFDIVFIPGLTEGVLPRKVFEDPLLLDSAAAELELPLPSRRDQIARERQLLSRAVATADRMLTVSFPRMDLLQGRSRVPSLHALEVLRAAEGRIPEIRDLEKRSIDEPLLRLGWPAPADPQSAIDEAEYDLSVLEPLLHDRGRPVRGQGRFLLSLNPWLARSLRARFKRWEPEWYDDDGLVAGRHPETLRTLSLHRLRERAYSPTALQHYAACPYRFFLHAIQRLRPREGLATLERMDPLVRGSLFHEVQFELFRRLESEAALDPGDSSLELWLDRADEILDRVAGRYSDDLAPALPRVWQGEVEEIRVDLRCWVRERHQAGSQWLPYRWEFSFGLPRDPGRDPRSREQDAVLRQGFRLRGAIDLIERDLAQGRLRITDHKTGRAPEKEVRWFGGGELLQPLLYAVAAERLLGETAVGGRLHYCTQRGNFRILEFRLEPAIRKILEWILETVDDSISSGFLPAAPRPDACTWCDYRQVCGPYEELRVKRKPQGPLKSLLEIRELQ